MNSRGLVIAVAAAAAFSTLALAQLATPPKGPVVMAPSLSAPRVPGSPAAAQKPQILWIKNELTGQTITPGTTKARKAADAPEPVFIYNNFDNPNGVAGINLNWNYAEASTNPDFSPPSGDPQLRFTSFNISSDPNDVEDPNQLVGDEKLCLMFEPYRAADGTWPETDLNTRHKLNEYTSVVASYSAQFEIRVCRVYFFSRSNVNEPYDPTLNPYKLELQLAFAFASFAYQYVESAFSFDLSGFDPPLTIKGDGMILTHWMKLSQPPVCLGDFNEDGLVDDTDFLTFFPQYNILDCADENMPNFCSADLDFDGFVDDADFVKFLASYNNLLCPPGFLIRGAYAPIAGGRYDFDNEDNFPGFDAATIPTSGWPFPSSLVTVPLLTSPYPPAFEVGCAFGGCMPSFYARFTTLTGFHTVNELNMDADFLKPEYERFVNQCAANNRLATIWWYNLALYQQGGFPTTDWYPSSTAKRFSVSAPETPR
ncbi:MAG: hypothetical protein JNK16_03120 [Phycisphaerales bacterium]|nr:hypothetical protein [Phycisphaerales bacterium]